MVLNRRNILFIMSVLGQHQKNHKERVYWQIAGEDGNCRY